MSSRRLSSIFNDIARPHKARAGDMRKKGGPGGVSPDQARPVRDQ
ncbi:hypothetical protein PH5382_00055 [Phaeobacter sp. CECT 5382]|nr:hypothetical protein PH5382_00055 [Phaeobacter sp. CECT 5382]